MGEAAPFMINELVRAKEAISDCELPNLKEMTVSMARCVHRMYEDPKSAPKGAARDVLVRLDRIMGAWNVSKEVSVALGKSTEQKRADKRKQRRTTSKSGRPSCDSSSRTSSARTKAFSILSANTLEDDLQSLPGSPSANYKPPDRQPDGPTSKVKEHELWCGMKAMSRQQGLLQVQVDIKRRLLAESQAQRVFLWMHTG